MKQTILTLLCLGLLLTGCTSGNTKATFAGLTIEEHRLVRNGERGILAVLDVLGRQPEIRAKRKRWRDLPRTDGVSIPLTPEEQMRLLHPPIKVGDSVAHVRVNDQWEAEVVQNGQVVYTYRHPQTDLLASPTFLVQGFTAWNGNWVLETPEERVIVGGESLNERLGHAKMFNFRMIGGKPFFFVKQDGKVRMYYDGQVLPQQYDQVPHYGCCDADACCGAW